MLDCLTRFTPRLSLSFRLTPRIGEDLVRTAENPLTGANLPRGEVADVLAAVVVESMGLDVLGDSKGEEELLEGDAMDSQSLEMPGRERRGFPRLRLRVRPPLGLRWNTPGRPPADEVDVGCERKKGRVAGPLALTGYCERQYSIKDGLFGGEIIEKSAVGAGLGGGGDTVNLCGGAVSESPAKGNSGDKCIGGVTETTLVSMGGNREGPACGSVPKIAGANSGSGVDLAV